MHILVYKLCPEPLGKANNPDTFKIEIIKRE